MDVKSFTGSLKERDIVLTEKQLSQFDNYFRILVEWNEKMNLTAITSMEEVYLKHFYDSITPAFFFKFTNQSLCDVGAGAGFPSIPLKICFPDLHITIVDSLNKRIQFLNYLASKLELTKVRFVHDRAETFGRIASNREQYEIVTARAVAKMSVLSELCLPLVKKGGTFIALKGPNTSEELQAAKNALFMLGGKVKEDIKLILPEEESERHIIIIDKTKLTPFKYPRRPGIPNREPLE